MKKSLVLVTVIIFTVPACGAAQDYDYADEGSAARSYAQPQNASLKQEIKSDARQVKHGIKRTAKQVKYGIKNGVKNGAREVKQGVKETFN